MINRKLQIAIDYAFGTRVSELAVKYGVSDARVYQILHSQAQLFRSHYTLFRTSRMQYVLLDRARGPLRYVGRATSRKSSTPNSRRNVKLTLNEH